MSRREKSESVAKSNTKFYIFVGAIILVIIVLLVIIFSGGKEEPVEPYEELTPGVSDPGELEEPEDSGKYTTSHGVKFEIVDETVYTTINLNIREQPSIDGKKITNAATDTKFNRIGIGANGWDMLKLDNGDIAFASSEYLSTKTARAGTSGTGYKIAQSTGRSVSNTPIDKTHYTTNTLKDGVSVSEADKFFTDAVFYGDSVTLGFQNYVDKQSKGFLGGMIVYGMGSYGIGNSLKSIGADSLHPIYKGYQTQLWDLTNYLQAKKVFLMFGLNDLGLYGVTDSLTNYKTLIDAIKSKNPDTKIYVLSTTPVTTSYNGKYLNNSNIRLFNQSIRDNASYWGITFIDVASYLMDTDGGLNSTFASDGNFHLTTSAYTEWVKVLRSFASYNL